MESGVMEGRKDFEVDGIETNGGVGVEGQEV